MYKISLSAKAMNSLWRLRTYCGEAPISRQVQTAVNQYLRRKEKEIGTSIEDLTDTLADYSKKERERNESKD